VINQDFFWLLPYPFYEWLTDYVPAARRHHCQSFERHVNGDVAQVTWRYRNLYPFSNSWQYNPAYVDVDCGNCYAVKSGRESPIGTNSQTSNLKSLVKRANPLPYFPSASSFMYSF
jgi:hypothetical protein